MRLLERCLTMVRNLLELILDLQLAVQAGFARHVQWCYIAAVSLYHQNLNHPRCSVGRSRGASKAPPKQYHDEFLSGNKQGSIHEIGMKASKQA